MTYQPSLKEIAALKKHERSINRLSQETLRYFRSLRRPELDLGTLAGWPGDGAALRGLRGPLLPLMLAAGQALLAAWAERRAARQALALASARDLADLGLSPAQAAFDASRPLWQPLPDEERPAR